jgi:hypothetical protein
VPADDLRRKLEDRLGDVLSMASPGHRVIEIGCAEGLLGCALKERIDVEYTGVEPSADADAAAGVLDRVVRGTSDAVDDGPYDVLLAFHVLEHIVDVESELTRWRALLRPSGVGVVEVPDGTGHPLLAWDGNREHVHYFSAASLASLASRCGLRFLRLSGGHFESVVYPDCLRLAASPAVGTAERRRALLHRFTALFSRPFAVYGVGGDFRNYVAPLLDDLPVVALLDSNMARHGERVGPLTVSAYDATRHAELPILVASVRFKAEIAAGLCDQGVAPERVFGLDDVYGRGSYNDHSESM